MSRDSIHIPRFVAASARYVKDAVAQANSDGNPYLTKTEARALPKDLQDNFESYRAGTLNGVVTAGQFVRDYAKYVQVESKRADLDGNDVLDLRELRLLPKDLQDNAARFGGLTLPPSGPGTVDDVSLPLSAETLETVRGAFVDYVEDSLTVRRPSEWDDEEYEYDNADWARLVHEFGGDGEHEALKAQLLDVARNWTPDLAGWETRADNADSPYFRGHFEFLGLEVGLENGKAPTFFTEID